jgi:integrase/recombinase XerD
MSLPKLIHPEQDVNLLKMKNVSLVLFLDVVRMRKDNTATIKIRIVFNRFPKYYSTGISLSEIDYLKMCGQRPVKELSEIKRLCFAQLKRACDIIVGMRNFTFELFDVKFNSLRKSNDIISYFDDYIRLLNEEQRHGTAYSYTCAKKKLIQFVNKKKAVSFDDISVSFLKRFEYSMISEGLSPTTVGIYCRCFRKLFNDAIRTGDVDKEYYPFGIVKHGLYSPPQPKNIKKAYVLRI